MIVNSVTFERERNIRIQQASNFAYFVKPKYRRYIMWTKPAATEMRFGFEVTMYVMNK